MNRAPIFTIRLVVLIGGCTASRPQTPTPQDADGEGLPDEREQNIGTDPKKADTNDDRLDDGAEMDIGSNPLKNDTDRDGLSATDEADGYGSLDIADPHVKFESDGVPKKTDSYEDAGEVTEPTSLTIDIPDDQNKVQLQVSLWDEDSHWNPGDQDDQLDVNNAGPGILVWKGTYSASSSNTMQVQTEGGR